ncbi:oxygenase MpaB family protein [Streptacidiphilus sp. PAMC 29251]
MTISHLISRLDELSGLSLRRRIGARVNATVHGADLHLASYQEPRGDLGLFGPDSVVWRVHGDIPGMITGGLAALLLQSLHPLAIAGVDQHSDFRDNPIERLNRTAGFVSVTSYGSTRAAEDALARVRRVHTHVRGTAPDGRPYSAADPALLTWVHTAEAVSFLSGYQAFGPGRLSTAEQDRYLAEAATVAQRLGAEDVPTSRAEVRGYFARIRPELAATDAALAAAQFLRHFGATPTQRTATRILFNGSVGLLPRWAARALDLERPPPARGCLDRPAVHALGAVLRYGTQPSAILDAAHTRTAPAPAG